MRRTRCSKTGSMGPVGGSVTAARYVRARASTIARTNLTRRFGLGPAGATKVSVGWVTSDMVGLLVDGWTAQDASSYCFCIAAKVGAQPDGEMGLGALQSCASCMEQLY